MSLFEQFEFGIDSIKVEIDDTIPDDCLMYKHFPTVLDFQLSGQKISESAWRLHGNAVHLRNFTYKVNSDYYGILMDRFRNH